MKLHEIYADKDVRFNGIYEWVRPVISFEVFPPDTQEKTENLYQELELLKKYNPEFISLTCGAAGKNSDKSKKVLKEIHENLDMNVIPHFTCICNNQVQIEENLNFIEKLGTENILALRGDQPEDIEVCYRDFRYANQLVEFIKQKTDFSVAVAGYPEGHIDCEDIHEDIKNLKKKVDAGADAIFTQMFFDNNKFFNYVHLIREEGIHVPVIPGIMPIISLNQIKRMLSLAKISIPKPLIDRLEKHEGDSDYIKKLGIDFASYQCKQLIDAEVCGLHFFTLNKSHSTAEILENIL